MLDDPKLPTGTRGARIRTGGDIKSNREDKKVAPGGPS